MVKDIGYKDAFPAVAYRTRHPTVIAVDAGCQVSGQFFQGIGVVTGGFKQSIAIGGPFCRQCVDCGFTGFRLGSLGEVQLIKESFSFRALGLYEQLAAGIHTEKSDRKIGALCSRMLTGLAGGGQFNPLFKGIRAG